MSEFSRPKHRIDRRRDTDSRKLSLPALQRYEEGSWPAVDSKKRGRKTGTGRRLDAEQETEIRRIIQDENPDQLKIPFALRTRGAVVGLIKAKRDIDISIRTLADDLKRWGLTPKEPIQKADEQNLEAVSAWLELEPVRYAA